LAERIEEANQMARSKSPAPGPWVYVERATTIVVLCVAVVVGYQYLAGTSPPPETTIAVPKDPIGISGTPRLGDPGARIGLVVFSDFECPFCARFADETWPAFRKEYVDTGRVQVFFRHYPLAEIHRQAVRAAAIAECAHREGRFWQMHDLLFGQLGRGTAPGASVLQLDELASVSGLDHSVLAGCAESQLILERVAKQVGEAKALGLRSTPVFMAGRVEANTSVRVSSVLKGALPLAEFQGMIDRLLAGVRE
jgi:protein-disulfide isomerase